MSMTQKEIGPTGPAYDNEFELPPDVHEHLGTIVESHLAHAAELIEFIDKLEHAARNYMALVPLAAEATPRRVREELRRARRSSMKLLEDIRALGGVSRYILHSEVFRGSRDDFVGPLYAACDQLARAVEVADELPTKGGRPRRFEDLQMARYVAHLIRTGLGVKPNVAVGGLYDETLKTLIAAV